MWNQEVKVTLELSLEDALAMGKSMVETLQQASSNRESDAGMMSMSYTLLYYLMDTIEQSVLQLESNHRKTMTHATNHQTDEA